MEPKISLGVVDISPKERAYVNDALDRGRLSPGQFVAGFEQAFAKEHDCRYTTTCNSGTSALQVAHSYCSSP